MKSKRNKLIALVAAPVATLSLAIAACNPPNDLLHSAYAGAPPCTSAPPEGTPYITTFWYCCDFTNLCTNGSPKKFERNARVYSLGNQQYCWTPYGAGDFYPSPNPCCATPG